ncbi:MAG: CPBP family intramembrane metalloprotease [Calditrichaeota bacterium]|nr:CPBP family intramembrane metalloprotease [Calditrichota bacterium]
MESQGHPWRALLLGTLVCVVAGVFVFGTYFYQAFPLASVKFKLTRAQALSESAELMQERGVRNLGDYRRTAVFSVDQMASNYLEREVGLERANRLMADSVAAWSWFIRYFQPLQKLEYEIHFTPGGRFVKYSRHIEENASGAFLSLDSARALAQDYLLATTGLSLDELEEKIAASTDMPNRRDHKFEWEKKNFRAKEATLRYRVEIQGDEVGFFREYVKVPEAWERQFERERASNELFQSLAQFFAVLLGIGIIVTLFRELRSRNLAGRVPFLIGAALAVGLFLMALNSWPLVFSGYDTTQTFASFFLRFVLVVLFGSALVGAVVWLSAQAGEPLYRRLLPENLSLERTFSGAATSTRAFARATIAGYAMAFGHVAFVILFYLLGKRIGFWAPQEVEYSNAVSSYLPWLYPLVISFYAATFEEFGFRLFAIPFLKKIFRSTFVAVLIPALIWGFLHSGYPQQPGWVRGVEVGAIGVVAGYVMLRFGILATLVWHYTVDAFFIGFFLLKSGSTYLVVSGVVVSAVLLVPLAIALTHVIRHRTFATQQGLMNRDWEAQIVRRPEEAVSAAAPPVSEVTWQAPRWSEGKWRGWLSIAILAVLLLSVIPVTKLGDGIVWNIGPTEAKRRAEAFLREQNLDTEGWHRGIYPPHQELSGSTVRYLSREAGMEGIERYINGGKLPLGGFAVRFFKPLQKEERIVRLSPRGKVNHFGYTLDEKAPGASLSQDSARVLATTFLALALRFDTSGFYVLSSGTTVRDERVDHEFTYQTERDSVGPARLRVDLSVVGHQPSGGGLYLHVPEEWERQDEKGTLLRTVAQFLVMGLWAALVILLLIQLIYAIRSGELKWSSGVGWSLLWAGLTLLSLWSRWESIIGFRYDTSKPLASWMASTLVGSIAGVVVVSLLIVVLVPLMRWLFEKRVGRPYSFSGWAPAPDAPVRWQSVAGAILAALSIAAVSQLLWWLTLSLGLPTRTPPTNWMAFSAEKWPFITLLHSGLDAIFLTAIIGFILLWIWPKVRPQILRAAILVFVPLVFAIEEGHGAGEVFGEWIRLIGMLLWVVFLLKNYLQQSPLALFATIWLVSTIPQAVMFLRQDSSFYVMQGLLGIVGAILPVFFWLMAREKRLLQ